MYYLGSVSGDHTLYREPLWATGLGKVRKPVDPSSFKVICKGKASWPSSDLTRFEDDIGSRICWTWLGWGPLWLGWVTGLEWAKLLAGIWPLVWTTFGVECWRPWKRDLDLDDMVFKLFLCDICTETKVELLYFDYATLHSVLCHTVNVTGQTP